MAVDKYFKNIKFLKDHVLDDIVALTDKKFRTH